MNSKDKQLDHKGHRHSWSLGKSMSVMLFSFSKGQRACSLLPVMKTRQHVCSIFPQRSPLEIQHPHFYWWLVIQAPSVQYVPKFQITRRKSGAQHKTLCSPSMYSEPRLSFKKLYINVGNYLLVKFPDANQGLIFQELSKYRQFDSY